MNQWVKDCHSQKEQTPESVPLEGLDRTDLVSPHRPHPGLCPPHTWRELMGAQSFAKSMGHSATEAFTDTQGPWDASPGGGVGPTLEFAFLIGRAR